MSLDFVGTSTAVTHDSLVNSDLGLVSRHVEVAFIDVANALGASTAGVIRIVFDAKLPKHGERVSEIAVCCIFVLGISSGAGQTV